MPPEFFTLVNAVLYVGSATVESTKAMADLQIENLRRHFAERIKNSFEDERITITNPLSLFPPPPPPLTGPQGGVWVPLGGPLKDMWEKAIPGLSVQALPGAGIANVRGIEEGKTEVGFGNSISTVDAIRPAPAVQQAAPRSATSRRSIRNTSRWWCAADAQVNSIKDLKGKALAAQPRGNTAEIITQTSSRRTA